MRIVASALLAFALAALPAGAQPKKKQVKDQAEQDLYNQAIHAEDPAARIQALDAWTARYPESDFKDDRLYFYMQAYAGSNPPQPSRIIEYGGRLMKRDLRAVFTGPEGALVILNVLFLVVRNVAAAPGASEEDLLLGRKAGRDVLDVLAGFKPPNTSDADWAAARADIEQRTRASLIEIALAPGNRAMRRDPPDCAVASAAFAKALEEFPESAPVSSSMGRALHCEGRIPQAIFHFLRAARQDPNGEFAQYSRNLYTAYHGNGEGFDAVVALANASPFPPADFRIETAAQETARRQAEFERDHPHLARWNAMREHLAAPYGIQYFQGQVKGQPVTLKGTVTEGRPSCRPKELLVSIGQGARPEIQIRLDSAPAGTIVPGEIEFTAVPRAFTSEPFLLTMEADRAKLVNLKIGPCAER